MAATSRRTVITGIGVLNPVGQNLDSFWQAMLAGRSGIRPLKSFDTNRLPVHIGGEIEDFDPKKYLTTKEARRSIKVMARTILLAVSAAQLALDDSKIDKEKLNPERFGCEFGAGLIASELEELAMAAQVSVNCQPHSVDLEKWGEHGIPSIQPLWMLKYLPNMLACQVSILHNAQGPNNTITESEVASLMALGEAYRILERDGADFFLVGGADSRLSPLSMVRQVLFLSLSRRNDAPEKASRPFDKSRDGVVVSEGSGVLAVEDLEHAQRRGARIYAEVVGFGTSFDRLRTGAGLARAVRAAMKEAGIGPDDLDHVNAQGWSTVKDDIWEARGLHEALEGKPVPVFAAKSYFGNLSAGSGISEMAASLLGFHHGVVPPTLNYETPDPECPIKVLAGSPKPLTKPYFLKVGFTEMGQCAAVVCKKWT